MKQQILSTIGMTILLAVLAIYCTNCHFTSTGTMIYNFKEDKVISFKPSPVLPGRFREVIICASPNHSCLFTMQSVREHDKYYTLIRKKDLTGKELASYRIMCATYPDTTHFTLSPECDRIFMTGCHPVESNKTRKLIDLNDIQGFSCWCDLPDTVSDMKIYPRKMPSNFGSDMYLTPSTFHRQNGFLRKDLLLCLLHKGNAFANTLLQSSQVSSTFPVYLSKIDLNTNKYQIIKELKEDDGSDFAFPPDEKVGIKINNDGIAAILVNFQLYIYEDITETLSEGIHIIELPHTDCFIDKLDFAWISNEDVCIWKYYDEENQGNYVIYNIRTKQKKTGKINVSIKHCFSPSIFATSEGILNLSTKENKKYPHKIGSVIYETFWLGDGLLGFNCDF